MMNKDIKGIENPRVALISDATYFDTVQYIIAKSNKVCWASLFIVELKSGSSDPDIKVFQVLRLLKEAQWRGVDVKLLIGGSRDNVQIAESSEVARSVAINMGLDCKWITSSDVRGSHCKLVIADNMVLTGSHNWSAPAFTNQIQDSLLVDSSAMAAYSQRIFYNQWNRK